MSVEFGSVLSIRISNNMQNNSFILEFLCFAQVPEIVFASSVQSGFLPPKRATVDRNRSRTDPHIAGTEPDHLGPVYFGPWDRFKPIQTGFFR
jgi:hypothetical protein